MRPRLSHAIEEARRWSVLVLLVLTVALGYYVATTRDSVHSLKGSIDRIEQSSSRTEAAADELVAFVHEIQKQQQNSSGQQAVATILHVLCASSDPARQQACAQLTGPGG